MVCSHHQRDDELRMRMNESCGWNSVDLETAGPIWLKLGVLVDGMCVITLVNLFFASLNQDQISVPHVPLLGHGVVIETPNLVCRGNWLCSTHPPQAWNFHHQRNNLHYVVCICTFLFQPNLRNCDGSLIKKVMYKFGQSLSKAP